MLGVIMYKVSYFNHSKKKRDHLGVGKRGSLVCKRKKKGGGSERGVGGETIKKLEKEGWVGVTYRGEAFKLVRGGT